ncbi:unnamed protein product [Spirodela intermedia]|uniref:Mechanosensitive ion channel MscS domain-containing protein n=1 Tax=Spirodela intermedia TaxID=51605 RepID=A0A7I8L1B9_SPIIN|nr:unnamed protein product [Spirodela intermedia]
MMSTVTTLKSFQTIRCRVSTIYCATYYSFSVDASKFSFRHLPRALGFTAFDRDNVREWPTLRSPERRQQKIVPHHSYNSGTMSCSALQNTGTMNDLVHSGRILFPASVSQTFTYRAYSSPTGNNRDSVEFTPASSKAEFPIQSTEAGGNEWVDIFNRAYQSALDAATNTQRMAKEASDEVVPYIDRLFESHPYLKEIVIPVGWTLSATVLAWLVLPRLLRRLHHYVNQTSIALLSGGSPQESVPYEKSLWGSLEDPARYLITFIAFSQLGVFIAPTTSQYLSQAWRGALVLSVVWFLHRWKTNIFSLGLTKRVTLGLDRDRLVALDKLSSVGLIILGMMALAEACGIAVQSILTVGGIGGVATAFAAKDILGNLLSGLSLQFSHPFSIGDSIKAGSIEGRVVEMGLTTTSLINQENFPIIVPNSLFSSQVIVNKTRAQFRALVKTIPFCIDDLEKIPDVSESVKSMLKGHPAVIFEREVPYCFLSRIEDSYAELTLGCTLRNKGKAELYATEQDILLQVTQIIRQHGARLGSTLNSLNSR